MLCITVHLLGASYRADPDGSRSRAEWPPAPSRVLDALISAGRGDQARGWEPLKALYAAHPPMIYATSRYSEQASASNFSATQRRGAQEVQSMPGREAARVRRGPKVCVSDPEVQFVWPDIDLPAADIEDLSHRAARVGYMGCADSKVLLSVSSVPPAGGFDDTKRWEPVAGEVQPPGCVLVNVGSLQHLEAAMLAFEFKDPRDRRRARQKRSRCWYRYPRAAVPVLDSGGSAVWLQFSESLPAGLAVKAAYALKVALMSRWHDYTRATAPWWINGHDTPEGRDYQLARFLVLPAVGHLHADGRLHGACVWIPDGTDMDASATAASLVRTLGTFRVPDLGDVSVVETDTQSRRRPRWSADPVRWTGPALRWVTALPALNDRHGFPTPTDVVRWCAQAGLPEPSDGSVTVSRRRLIRGGVELRVHQMNRPQHRSTRGFAHVAFTLPQPVVGPVAVGAGRSYGLGLCAPDAQHDPDS